MLFSRNILFLLLAFNYSYPYSIKRLSVSEITQDTWNDLRACYIYTFSNAYKDVSPDVFGQRSIEEFCADVFDADKKNIEHQDLKCILVEENGTVIAYVLMHECQPENRIHILHIAVGKNVQHKGMGRMLLDLATHTYPNASHICLSTRDFNANALGFYKHLGFYEVDSLPQLAMALRPKNVHIVYLEKSITSVTQKDAQ